MNVRNYYFLTKHNMSTKVVTCTSKGQITIPKKWRDKFNTSTFTLSTEDNKIVIMPINPESLQDEIIFDADRDNRGAGITPDEMIKMITETQNGR